MVANGAATAQFNCPICNALYHQIKAEAGPETIDRAFGTSSSGLS